jgi:hypothetical protein
MEDLPALDALQKKYNKALGFFPRAQMEGYIKNGWVLVAEEGQENQGREIRGEGRENADSSLAPCPSPLAPLLGLAPCPSPLAPLLGYIASRDRYLKRDELGVIYQLCVAPGSQRGLIGASLVREVFARSAYGCRLYCCWCAKDLEANHFWEAMGFVPIAFRAGSAKKSRVHIFWQKRIVEGDEQTKWWYPSQTNQGAIREDRLVFPIPPGVSWRDVEAMAVPGGENPKLEDPTSNRCSKQIRNPKLKKAKVEPRRAGTPMGGFRFHGDPTPPVEPGAIVKASSGKAPRAPRAKAPKVKIDPRLLTAARELRDRWMERVNDDPSLIGSSGKYDVTRALTSYSYDQPAFGSRQPQLAA